MSTAFCLQPEKTDPEFQPTAAAELAEAAAVEERQFDPTSRETTAARTSESVRLRLERVCQTEIRYIHSTTFEAEDAAETILGRSADVGHSTADERDREPTDPPPGTPPYLAALYAIPLLTRDEERDLFRKMNFLKYRAEQFRRLLIDGRSAAAQRDQLGLIEQIEHDLSAALEIRNRIVRANLRLVVSIAKSLVDAANPFDEIVSEGNLPLIRAAELFDFERGTRFSTYATWAVRNSLYRSTTRNRRRRKRFPSSSGVIDDSLVDHRSSPLASETYHRRLREAVERMLDKLEGRDRTIVSARFGLNGHRRPHKFREIAEKLNLSTERVRQLMARSLDRLHDLAANESVEVA